MTSPAEIEAGRLTDGLIVAGVDPRNRPVDVVLAAVAMAEQDRARLSIILCGSPPAPFGWTMSSIAAVGAGHVYADLAREQLDAIYGRATGILSLTDLAWTIELLQGINHAGAVARIARERQASCLVVARPRPGLYRRCTDMSWKRAARDLARCAVSPPVILR